MKTIPVSALLLFTLLIAPAGAYAPYCEGAGCPTRYVVDGFEVWMSPSLPDNPAYSHEYLERYLDTVHAQLLYMGSKGVIPKQAMDALRDSGLTFYFDDPDNQQEWWPCAPGPGGCYAGGDLNRIGGSFWRNAGNVMDGWNWQSFVLHEAAHVYHGQVVDDAYGNRCIIDAYERNRRRYASVENSARASGVPPDQGVQIVEHWAYTSPAEYFAELSEAYFFRGTSYPWNRLELYKHDSEGYFMVREAWNDPGFCDAGFEDSLSGWLTHEQQQQARRGAEELERAAWQTAEQEVMDSMWNTCTIQRSSFGGSAGTPFHPVDPSRLSMRSGAWIDALILDGHQYGGNGGGRAGDLDLLTSEYISRAVIGAGVYVDQLEFHTNLGRSLSGGEGTSASSKEPVSLDNIRVLRIGGRSSAYLDRIELMYCSDYDL